MKDTKNNSPKKKGSSVNATIESNSEDEAAFFVEGGWESDSDLLDLITVSDSDSVDNLDLKSDGDSEGDWFSEIGSDEGSGWDTKDLFETDGSKCSSLVSVDSNSEASDLDEAAVSIEAGSTTDHIPCVEVYASGCMRHITPY